MKNAKVSIIIPAYNEQHVIGDCLQSLIRQTYKLLEIIVVDDGSTDKTISIIENLLFDSKLAQSEQVKISRQRPASQAKRGKRGSPRAANLSLLHQKHKGPGHARNLGAKSAKGKVLVFVDADMTFDENFINDLTKPIMLGQTIGTFSKNEMNANKNNVWSKCWNLNRTATIEKLIPNNYPDTSPVFRAILKREFQRVGGFTSKGEYTDDWSLSEKLNKKASLAPGAIYYHSNPSSLAEIWKQAQWFSTNKFISGNFVRFAKSLIFYSFPMSLIIGIYKSIVFKNLRFLFFRLWFDFAVWTSLFKSFSSKNKAK